MALPFGSNLFPESWDKNNTVFGRLQVLLTTSQWSDCTFLVGDEVTQVFKAHRLILASCSPVFEAMCFGPLAERDSIIVPDIDPKTFQTMLRYIYTDTVDIFSIEDACSTLYVGHKYMLTVLTEICRDYIRSHIAPSNVIYVFEFLQHMGETDLYEPCLLIISKYTEMLLIEPKNHMKPSTLAIILKLDTLSITEPLLFKVAVNWAEEECQQRGLGLNSQNLRKMLLEAEALSNLRFLTFSPEDFLRGPSNSKILTCQEINALWNAIHNKGESKENIKHIENLDATSKPLELPEGLSQVSEFRHKISPNKLYCVRSFLKASQVVPSFSLNLMTTVTVSKPIFLLGLRFPTRVMPKQGLGRQQPLRATYKEDMKFCIFSQGKEKLLEMVFKGDSEYVTKATVIFKESLILVPGEEYSILVESLCADTMSSAEYPIAFLSHAEATHGTVFTFCDYCPQNSDGSFAQRLDVGFIDSVVFAPA